MHPPASAPDLVRVTVAAGARRADLVLPAQVPVAELLPELVRGVGLLDVRTVHGGHRVVTREGRALAADASLVAQGVEDGVLLVVTAGVDDEPPLVYDDVVEAMADVVERDLGRWSPAAGRRTALAAASLLLGLGAVALLVQDGALATAAAASIALGLVAGAVVLSRVRRTGGTAVVVAWTALGHAAVAGLLLAPGGPLLAVPAAAAGGGVVLVGMVALVGLGGGRALVLPPVLVGAVLLASGTVVRLAGTDPAVVLTVVLALVVAGGSLLPSLALGAAGTGGEQEVDPGVIDPAGVRADARLGHELLVALSATVGLLLVLVSPLAVGLGAAGALVAVTCCLVVMLRTRHHRVGSEVLAGLVSGIAGLASVALSSLWLHPDWRPVAAVVLPATGAVLLALTLWPLPPSVRRDRLGDLAETAGLVCLPPLLLLATGVLTAVRG